ncbi:DUF881 domain-containing protein [Propioniciclava flava]
MTVTLTDTPATVQPAGLDEDLLVVHQQDIQVVINALWASGAEAVTVQGQRIGARTGIKCVGNTVVVHGVPYAPPDVISAIGDHARLAARPARQRLPARRPAVRGRLPPRLRRHPSGAHGNARLHRSATFTKATALR